MPVAYLTPTIGTDKDNKIRPELEQSKFREVFQQNCLILNNQEKSAYRYRRTLIFAKLLKMNVMFSTKPATLFEITDSFKKEWLNPTPS